MRLDVRLIIDKLLLVHQPFAQQKGGQRKQTIRSLKIHLQQLANGSERELLEALLSSQYGKAIMQNTRITRADHKLKLLVSLLHDNYKRSTDHKKRQWSSLVSTVFTRDELNLLNWKICSEVSLICCYFFVDRSLEFCQCQ